jgi:hypothetical protein
MASTKHGETRVSHQAGEAGELDLVLLVDLLEHPDTVSRKVGVSVRLGELVWLDNGTALLVIAVEDASGARSRSPAHLGKVIRWKSSSLTAASARAARHSATT